ncbi:tubulin-dependent ATPase kip3, partial [Spiromyces aspiralis]
MDIEESDSAVFSTTTLTNGGDNAGPRRPGPVQAADGTTAGTLASNPTSSQAAILVAVRVRPFSGKELNMMPPSYRKRYAPVRAVGSQADADEDTALAQAGTAPQPKEFLRKVVHAIDDHVLVFDPPDEDDEDEARRAPAASNKRHKDVRFVFDKVFGPESQQQDVYEGTTRGLLDA